MRIYPRNRIWHCEYRDNDGTRVRRTTGCTEQKAAEACARQFERDAAAPHHAAAQEVTLSLAVTNFLSESRELVRHNRRAQGTQVSYESKAGHLIRILERADGDSISPLRLSDLTRADVNAYINQRRDEEVKEHTIHKELVVLRGVLQSAKGRRHWKGDIDEVIPPRFSAEYRPRTRFLTPDELDRLIGQLRPDRAAVVAFIAATSAEWSAVTRAQRDDVSADRGSVTVRGSKSEHRLRSVPVVSGDQVRLLNFALSGATGTGSMLFRPWLNVRRDLRAACARAGIAPCSPHDLRRTFASWMIQGGVTPHLIAKMMGHSNSQMVERVYAQLRPEDLKRLVADALERGPKA